MVVCKDYDGIENASMMEIDVPVNLNTFMCKVEEMFDNDGVKRVVLLVDGMLMTYCGSQLVSVLVA